MSVFMLVAARQDLPRAQAGVAASADSAAGHFEPGEWEAAKHDDISVQEVRCARSSISGSLADA